MMNDCFVQLSDPDLLAETRRVAELEQRTTARLIALLAELDSRKLYLAESCPSLFVYCTNVLHLSESAAYSRITAARAARDFPVILTLLADGAVTLTTISLLAAHLSADNHEGLLDAARHKSRRDVERLVAAVDPQPDVPSSVRQLPAARRDRARSALSDPTASALLVHDEFATRGSIAEPAPSPEPARRSLVAPLAPQRYLIKMTVSHETRAKLDRARDLLRHTIPSGDPAAIFDRALTILVAQLETAKRGGRRATRSTPTRLSNTRYVPAAVKSIVWTRDNGRCAFVGAHGRCAETGFLEFHHVQPFAAGGQTSVDNLELRCRSHNVYEADCFFGVR